MGLLNIKTPFYVEVEDYHEKNELGGILSNITGETIFSYEVGMKTSTGMYEIGFCKQSEKDFYIEVFELRGKGPDYV